MYPRPDGTAAFEPEHQPALPLQRCLLGTLDPHSSGKPDHRANGMESNAAQITVYADNTTHLASPFTVIINSI